MDSLTWIQEVKLHNLQQKMLKTQALNWVLVILSICIIAHSILLKLSNGTKYSLKSHTYYVLEGVEGMNIHT
jgi:hypothetical protein